MPLSELVFVESSGTSESIYVFHTGVWFCADRAFGDEPMKDGNNTRALSANVIHTLGVGLACLD